MSAKGLSLILGLVVLAFAVHLGQLHQRVDEIPVCGCADEQHIAALYEAARATHRRLDTARADRADEAADIAGLRAHVDALSQHCAFIIPPSQNLGKTKRGRKM